MIKNKNIRICLTHCFCKMLSDGRWICCICGRRENDNNKNDKRIQKENRRKRIENRRKDKCYH